ncbi:MAG: hypothetical protein AAGK21_05550 [Bacteroidota bacterium]
MTRLATLALLVFAAAASSQTRYVSAPVEAVPSSAVLSTYAGQYVTDGGTIEVSDGDEGLDLIVRGAPIAARLAAFAPASATDARAASLLDAWLDGDLASVVTWVRTGRQDVAAESFGRYRSALLRQLGEVTASGVVGTFQQPSGHEVTLVQIRSASEIAWASFVWDGRDRLLTITSGLGPVALGSVRPAGGDTFEAAGVEITFEREADGRIGALRIDDQFVAVR